MVYYFMHFKDIKYVDPKNLTKYFFYILKTNFSNRPFKSVEMIFKNINNKHFWSCSWNTNLNITKNIFLGRNMKRIEEIYHERRIATKCMIDNNFCISMQLYVFVTLVTWITLSTTYKRSPKCLIWSQLINSFD